MVLGKSTLIKIILGEDKNYLGEVKIGASVKIGYIPKGFEQSDEIISETRRVYFYEKSGKDFLISITLNSAHDIQIDNEHAYEIRYVNHREIHISYDDQTQSGAVVIPDEIVTISVTGNIEKEELIRIAEDMK